MSACVCVWKRWSGKGQVAPIGSAAVEAGRANTAGRALVRQGVAVEALRDGAAWKMALVAVKRLGGRLTLWAAARTQAGSGAVGTQQEESRPSGCGMAADSTLARLEE